MSMIEKWKSFTEYLAYLWAKVEIKILEHKSQKKWNPGSNTDKFYAWRVPLHLSPSQAKRWDTLKRYKYSYETRAQTNTTDVTRAQGFDKRNAPEPTEQDIQEFNAAWNEYANSDQGDEVTRNRLKKLREANSPVTVPPIWYKTLPDGRVLKLSDEEYQELRKSQGLEPLTREDWWGQGNEKLL